MEILKEPLPTAPSVEHTTEVVLSTAQSPEINRDLDQKPIVINDANNNGFPEKDRNAASPTKNHVCQECKKTFVTKASLKVRLHYERHF